MKDLTQDTSERIEIRDCFVAKGTSFNGSFVLSLREVNKANDVAVSKFITPIERVP